MNTRKKIPQTKNNKIIPQGTSAYLNNKLKKIIHHKPLLNISTILRIYNLYIAILLTQTYTQNTNYFKDNKVAFQEHVLLFIGHFLPTLLNQTSTEEFHALAAFLNIYPEIFHSNKIELPFQSPVKMPLHLINFGVHSHASLHLFRRTSHSISNTNYQDQENAITLFNALRLLNFFMATAKFINVDDENNLDPLEFLDIIFHLALSMLKPDASILTIILYFHLNIWSAMHFSKMEATECSKYAELNNLDDMLHTCNLMNILKMVFNAITLENNHFEIFPEWVIELKNFFFSHNPDTNEHSIGRNRMGFN